MVRTVFRELRRRRVYQTIGLYIVGAWATLQVADLAFESWGIPETALRTVWIAAFLLFPLALVFGWRYDVTTTGIVRTPATEDADDLPLHTADYAVIGAISAAFIAALAGIVFNASRLPTDDAIAARPLQADAIAVLPFVSRSTAQETGFFADGVHDDLLTTLANISRLKVISRTSVLQYRDTTRNLRQIGRELGAANILEGGVQHVGNQVRINVQLIDARSDEHIWAETYDREMTIQNLFAIQSEIAETIAQALALELSTDEKIRIRRDRTDNLEAFNAYNRGKQLFARKTFEALRSSIPEFEKAIELDPDYVLARIALARTYHLLFKTGAIRVESMLENGQQHIDRALELDPRSGYAHAVMAKYEIAAGIGDPEKRLEKALSLSPNSVDVLDIYATWLRTEDRNEEALAYVNRALELDPLSASLWHDLGRSLVSLGRFEEANTAFRRISEIDPLNPQASHGAVMATFLGGQLAEAGYWADVNAKTDPDDFENTSSVAMIRISLGQFEAALEAIDYSLSIGPVEPHPLSAQTIYLTVNGRHAEAVDVARTALANQLPDRWSSEQVFLRTLRDEAIESGNAQEALGWYRQKTPELFDDEPGFDKQNIQKAADLGLLLQLAGEKDRAETLLERTIAAYDYLYVRGAANYPMSIAKVEALALLGRNDESLAELQRVVDDGWRLLWQWDTYFNRNLDGIRDDPRFTAITNFIEQDLAEQVRDLDLPR